MWKTNLKRLGDFGFSFHTFGMEVTASFYKAAKIPPRRYAWIFANPKFDLSASTPLDQKTAQEKALSETEV